MRRILVAGLLVGLAIWFWPYVGAYALARAAASRDEAALAAHIDRPALSRSLSRQIVTAYLRRTGRDARMTPLQQGLATAAGASIATPYLDQLLASGALATLLDDGRIGRITIGDRTLAIDRAVPSLRSLDAASAAAVVFHSYYDAPTRFRLSLPDPGGNSWDYGLQLRLSGLTWRLSGLELPPDVVDRIVADVMAAEKTAG